MGGELVYDHVNMRMRDVGMVSGLVNGGAFIDWQDVAGATPLHRAAHFRHNTTSRVLLQAGADPNLSDHGGMSPLHVAACTGSKEVVANLLQAGADFELVMADGHSPFHATVWSKRADVVSLLVNAGASTERRNRIYDHTPLFRAREGCLSPIVCVLVEAEADVESTSAAGLTPLHWAGRFIDAESVEILVNAAADPGAVDRGAANDATETS